MNTALPFETYGKQGVVKRIYNQVKYRFKVSAHTSNLLNRADLGAYSPKLNKLRFGTSIIASVALIIAPGLTLLAIPTMLWGIK